MTLQQGIADATADDAEDAAADAMDDAGKMMDQ